MRHDKLERELYLLQLLTENRSYTVSKLCDKVGISRRNLYYYLEFFRDCGFSVYKHGEYYCIDRSSPFFNRIIERVSFTEEEAILIRRLLSKTGNENALTENLKKKLDRFYDFDILTNDELREQAAHNIGILYQAIKFKQQVLLRGYVSLNSRTTKDRLVEPFMLMNNNNEVRCFEPSSRLNKTFKISRMHDVELLDTSWCYERLHRDLYTDIFMFSGEEQMPVKMILGKVAYNILKEEYPKALKYVTEMSDGRYLLDMYVCSYIGIGRFVLGLFEDIEVIENEEFREYLRKKIAALGRKLRVKSEE